MEPTISVIIPVYNGGEAFHVCVMALIGEVRQPDEIIIVADGGLNDSCHFLKELPVKVLETPTRSGPARARNLGAKEAKGDILFFLDADVVILPNTLKRILTLFQDEPDLTAAFGSYDDAPAQLNFLSQYRNLLHHYVHQHGNEDASTFWGACGAIRRHVFIAIGGFDDNLFRRPAIEDIELGCRLKQAGYKIRLCKSIQVKHLKHWGVFSILKTDFFQRALPWAELILRNRQFLNDLNLKTSSRISVVLTFALFGTVISAILWPESLLAAPVLVIILTCLNLDLYRFYQKKRGLWFALKTIPWHWLYFFYSGLAFAIGLIRHILTKTKSENPKTQKIQDKFENGV